MEEEKDDTTERFSITTVGSMVNSEKNSYGIHETNNLQSMCFVLFLGWYPIFADQLHISILIV